MPHTPPTTSIEQWALTLTVRTPSVLPHCFGKKPPTNLTTKHQRTSRKSQEVAATQEAAQGPGNGSFSFTAQDGFRVVYGGLNGDCGFQKNYERWWKRGIDSVDE